MIAGIAEMSDVHGMSLVLGAVLAEPDVEAVELIIVNDDHASGPSPARCSTDLTDEVTGCGWSPAMPTASSSTWRIADQHQGQTPSVR